MGWSEMGWGPEEPGWRSWELGGGVGAGPWGIARTGADLGNRGLLIKAGREGRSRYESEAFDQVGLRTVQG